MCCICTDATASMQSKHADKPVHFLGGGGGFTLKECEKLTSFV